MSRLPYESLATRVALISLFAILIGCQPQAPTTATAAKPAAAGPTIRATVVTIRTTMEPEKRTLTQTLVINGDRARDTSEHDEWRLFDTKANTVTFIDDIAKTFRTETLQQLIAHRRTITKGALPPHYPRARIVRPKTKKTMQGATAESIVIESGAYKRELWIAEHPSIPRGLFAMMEASDPPTEPLAPMMRDVDEVLTELRGFPLADHAEVPVAKAKLVVDRSVIGIATQDVQEALLNVPADYKDLTPKPKKQ